MEPCGLSGGMLVTACVTWLPPLQQSRENKVHCSWLYIKLIQTSCVDPPCLTDHLLSRIVSCIVPFNGHPALAGYGETVVDEWLLAVQKVASIARQTFFHYQHGCAFVYGDY